MSISVTCSIKLIIMTRLMSKRQNIFTYTTHKKLLPVIYLNILVSLRIVHEPHEL